MITSATPPCNASLLQVPRVVTSKLTLTCCKLNSSLIHSCHVKFVASLQILQSKIAATLLQTKIAIRGCFGDLGKLFRFPDRSVKISKHDSTEDPSCMRAWFNLNSPSIVKRGVVDGDTGSYVVLVICL
ncbi:hypothetical protein AVEN_38734-1 [Araneus ventricosus]|uniref:Uncharacterized protein n=1 Tax=Araneus ventricosus TaxID=182803 RepID=A0A4Y2F880_ARAVE|nr:hypothetical protein AVEN_269706-1 [Araneus ventricosus]GBM37756.1 hypothetical protein AVEN_38734-1 [Araneus ventricosus]